MIEGEINAQGQVTSYGVQYGTSTAYGSTAPATPTELAGYTSNHGVFTDVSGLVSGTTYHYRIVATNASGTAYGQDETFTTTGAAPTTTFTPFSVPSAPQVASAPYTFPPETSGAGTSTPRSLSRKQKLTRALKACKRHRQETKRAKCENLARKRYGPQGKAKTSGKRG